MNLMDILAGFTFDDDWVDEALNDEGRIVTDAFVVLSSIDAEGNETVTRVCSEPISELKMLGIFAFIYHRDLRDWGV